MEVVLVNKTRRWTIARHIFIKSTLVESRYLNKKKPGSKIMVKPQHIQLSTYMLKRLKKGGGGGIQQPFAPYLGTNTLLDLGLELLDCFVLALHEIELCLNAGQV